MRHCFLVAAVAALLLAATPSAPLGQTRADPEVASGFAAKPLVEAQNWMVVAAHPLASAAGAKMLALGGSAVDAAIAAQLVLNVVEPQSSGLGGGAFALHWTAATETLTAWDGRETAPAGATPELFLDETGAPRPWPEAVARGESVGAPGLPKLLAEMHAAHGALPWAQLVEEAIDLAANGFEVSPRMAASLERFGARLAANPDAAAVFLTPDGPPLAAGTVLKQPQLAETLRAYADEGADAFATGPIADAISAAASAAPGPSTLTLDDLAAYKVVRRQPVCMRYRTRYEVCGMGPPSSGATTVGQILGLLDHFPIHDLPAEDPRAWRLFADASRLAYADRAAYLADPDHVSVPADGLLDRTYLTLRAQAIDPDSPLEGRARAGAPPWREGRLDWAPDLSAGRPGTTHLSVVDSAGNVVSLTSSIETAFGSGRMAAGLLLNNQLTDFSFLPEIDGRPIANAVAPGKRPRSSMAPTIVFDVAGGERRPILALGSPGGSRIIEYVAGALVRLLDWNLDPNIAAAGPHVSQRNLDTTSIEARADADAIAADFEAVGRPIDRRDMTSGLHIIQIRDGVLFGGADPRREGVAIGE